MHSVVANHIKSQIEQRRYLGIRDSFRRLGCCRGRVLDFGASYGLSMLALHEIGLTEVYGVEIEGWRVQLGRTLLHEAGLDPDRLLHVEDSQHLPFAAGTFDTVVANAVLEHIPRPRTPYVKELWRVLKPGGCLVVAETPNKYLPFDYHTTKLWWIPWLPSRLARRYAIWRGRYREDKAWASSGWRGLGHYELVGALPRRSFRLEPERTRWRHRLLSALHLPPSLLDPYPVWLIRKLGALESPSRVTPVLQAGSAVAAESTGGGLTPAAAVSDSATTAPTV